MEEKRVKVESTGSMFRLPKAILQMQEILQRADISFKISLVSREGYYLSSFFLSNMRTSYLTELLDNWDTFDKADFNATIKEIMDDKLDELKNEVVKSINDRRAVVNEIFDLYKSRYYLGLVPLVLSQCDGLMKEISGGKWGLYSSNHENDKKNPNKLRFKEADLYYNVLSSYFQLEVENRNDYQLFAKGISDPGLFNRHSILHGESFQFGTELNAIKSILLISFIAELYGANRNE